MSGSTVFAGAGVLLLAVSSAHAITMAGLNPNSGPYAATSLAYGLDFSGVAALTIFRSNLGIDQCSGALLSDGVTVLTAAHCVADASGAATASAAYVSFTLPGGTYTSRAAAFEIDPFYDGMVQSPNDIAVLKLPAPPPLGVARYGLYFGPTNGQIMTVAGYGVGGTGATGYDPILYPFGTLRAGVNQYDSVGPLGQLLFDFDDGTAAHDALGDPSFVGPEEAFIAFGDSGGPSFINGQIAGVHSFIARMPNRPDGTNPDIDGVLDSSFGEYAGDVGVELNASFILSTLGPVPEPRTMFLVGLGLIVISLVGSRRHHH